MSKSKSAVATTRVAISPDFVRGRDFRKALNKAASRVACLAVGAKDKALQAGVAVKDSTVQGAGIVADKASIGAQRTRNFARGFFA